MVTIYKIPDNSMLKSDENSFDYVDCYQKSFSDEMNKIDITKVGKLFFASRQSKWIDTLFMIRNKVVGLLGLKTSGNTTDKQKQLDNFKCEKGEQIGLFKVFDKRKYKRRITKTNKTATNIGLAIWRLKCFYETFVQGSTFVLRLNLC